VLLALGHNFRHRGPRTRSVFWGGCTGYLAGVLVTACCAFLPPFDWTGGATLRTVAIHWSAMLGALLGILITVAIAESAHELEERQSRHG